MMSLLTLTEVYGGEAAIRISSAEYEPLSTALQEAQGALRTPHPFPTGPKGEAGSCCAAHTGSPQQRLPEPPPDTTQAVHPMPEGTPLFLPSHQCSGSCVCAWPTRWHWQKGFAPSTGSGQTDTEKDCHLLKPSHRLPTQLPFPPHLPSRYPPRYNRSCWLHQTGRQWTEAAELKTAYFQQQESELLSTTIFSFTLDFSVFPEQM